MTTSTINPAIPAPNSTLASGPIRSQFQAAINDINNLYSLIAAPLPINLSVYTAEAAGGNTLRTLASHFADYANVKDFGATGNGTTDDTLAILAAVTAGNVIIPAGTYVIGINLTVPATSTVTMLPGALLQIASGKTVTFNGGFEAGIYHVFSGSGTVAFNPQFTTVGYPEWWGAQTANASFDCAPALNACVIAVPVTQLQYANYYTNSTWKISTSGRIVRGSGFTQILINSGSLDCCLVGLSADPGGTNSFANNIIVEDIIFSRTLTIIPNASAGASCAGVRFQYVNYSQFENLNAAQHALPFAFSNIGLCYFNKFKAARSLNGTTSVNDLFWCYALFTLSTTYNIESCYWEDCQGATTGTLTLGGNSIGIAIDGNFTDCHFLRCEMDNLEYGALLNGSGSSDPSIDNSFIDCCFDQSSTYGLYIASQYTGSCISVMNCYCAPAVGATAAFSVQTTLAAISFTNCQGIGYGGSTAKGLWIHASQNVLAQGNMWENLYAPVVIDDGCIGISVRDVIHNSSITSTTAAVQITDSSRCVIDCIVNGNAADAFPAGIVIDSTSSTIEARCSGISSAVLPSGSSATKLVYNGGNITSAGSFGTNNLAQGIMA